MKAILSKRGNVVWEFCHAAWFGIAVVIYFVFLGII